MTAAILDIEGASSGSELAEQDQDGFEDGLFVKAGCISTGVLKDQLHQCLSNVKAFGSFATFGISANSINPGLYITGIGPIGLPLSSRDAKAIKEASHQAPFGKGSDTIVDTSVRKTQEIDAHQFELRNPAWQKYLQDIINDVAKDLGVGPSGVRAEPYKLLLYEKGAMFKPHRDSEKAPRMFGTMVICLPSEHEGGQVWLNHDRRKKTFDTAKTSAFEQSYIAWYADVTHEIRPVTSGNRLVLTYNLIDTAPGIPQSAASQDHEKLKLRNILTLWKTSWDDSEHMACPDKLAYMLDHKYTNASLRIDQLKGSDLLRARYLKEVCTETDICFFLANIERSVDGEVESDGEDIPYKDKPCNGLHHEIFDIFDDKLMLQHVVELDGSGVAKDLTLEESDIVQEEPFATGPDHEDFSGWTGNDGTTAKHYYRSTVALLMPRAMKLRFLFKPAILGQVDAGKWIERSLKAYQDDRSDKSKEDLEELCDSIIAHTRSGKLPKGLSMERQNQNRVFNLNGYKPDYQKPFSDEVLGTVVGACVQMESLKKAQKAVALVGETTPLSIFPELGKALSKIGFSRMKSLLDEAINHVTEVYEKFAAMESLMRSYKTTASSETELTESAALQKWCQLKARKILASVSEVSEEDGEALAGVAAEYGNNMLFQCVLPIAKKFVSNSSFTIGFTRGLFGAGEKNRIPENAVSNIFRDLLSDLIPAFTLGVQVPSPKRPRLGYTSYDSERSETSEESEPSLMTGGELADLIEQCISLGLEHEVDQILIKLQTEISDMDTSDLGTFVIPFLEEFLTILEEQEIPLSTPRYQSFFKHALNSYITRYVNLEPAPPKDGTRKELEGTGCGCKDCNSLNEFLFDPAQKSTTFSMPEKRRKHIELRIEPIPHLKVETIRTTKPFSLKVEKTEADWKEEHDMWEKRSKEVEKQLKGLGLQKLREILGEKYDELVEQRVVKLGDIGSETQAKSLRSNQNSV
ncbi:MAG: hypothetical protein M1836_003516 [Candelina mexicana]|nr:MAG: hypothetical protein M1836_003516 [Candelina mexicana]